MLIKLLSVLSLLGLVWGGVMTTLYLTTDKDLKASQIKVQSLERDIKSCIEDKDKQIQSSSVTEVVSTNDTLTIQSLEQENRSLLERLKSIPSKVPKCSNSPTEVKKDDEADIDDKLPSELISLLSERSN